MHLRPHFSAFIASLALGLSAGPAPAQTSTKIEPFPPLDAPRILDGLGWNVALTNEWEFEKVRAARGREVRVQFAWEQVESFAEGKLALPPKFEQALKWCQKYELEPLIVAAYGPPRARLMELTVTRDVPAGSTVLPVTAEAGQGKQLTDIQVPACHVLKAERNQQLVRNSKWGYYGALIAAVDAGQGTLTLAAATEAAVPAQTKLVVNQLRYPSVATIDPTDPSLAAYHRYVRFLADQIAAHGLKGKVEIWNEPPWAHDPWDHREAFYDQVPAGVTPKASPNWGMLRTLLTDTLPAGVRYTWGGSHKSGSRGVLFLPAPSPTQAQIAASVSSEGWHPYGPNPESILWDSARLLQPGNVFEKGLEGTNAGSNFKQGRQRAAANLQQHGWTVTQQISETGFETANQLAKARFAVRTFLAHLAAGPAPQIDRINFYRLSEGEEAKPGFGMIDPRTRTEWPAYAALKALMNDVATLGFAPPLTPKPTFLPPPHRIAAPSPSSPSLSSAAPPRAPRATPSSSSATSAPTPTRPKLGRLSPPRLCR